MKPVLTKKDFVRRYKSGEFGNASPSWEAREIALITPRPGALYHLRNKTVAGKTHYNLSWKQLNTAVSRLVNKQNWYISEMAPHESTIIQGETQRSIGGLYLRYTFDKRPMRDAWQYHEAHAYNLTAQQILADYLDQQSFEHLRDLLEYYVGHIIEFSTFGVEWGTVPGFRTVIWEVRRY